MLGAALAAVSCGGTESDTRKAPALRGAFQVRTPRSRRGARARQGDVAPDRVLTREPGGDEPHPWRRRRGAARQGRFGRDELPLFAGGRKRALAVRAVSIDWDAGEEAMAGSRIAAKVMGRTPACRCRADRGLGDEASSMIGGVTAVRKGRAYIQITLGMQSQREREGHRDRQSDPDERSMIGGIRVALIRVFSSGVIGSTEACRRSDGVSKRDAAATSPAAASAPASERASHTASSTSAPARATAPSDDPRDPKDTEALLNGLMAMFGEDDKPAEKHVAQFSLPDGFEPGGECPDPGPSADAEIAEQAGATIPIKEGLTFAYTWTRAADDYDHECLRQVSAIDRRSILLTGSCPVGKDRHLQSTRRRICRTDLEDSYMFEIATGPSIPETLRGALIFSLSATSFSALKTTGTVHHRLLELETSTRGGVQVADDSDGTLDRGDTRTYTAIVNDKTIELPVVEAIGKITTGVRPSDFRLLVLDDARFPFVLDYQVPAWKYAITYTRLSFPTANEVETHLAVDKRVDVYGIYFDFASDRLRAESAPVLREISEALAKNPAWTLTINGHTDNVGGDAVQPGSLEAPQRVGAARAGDTYHIDARGC